MPDAAQIQFNLEDLYNNAPCGYHSLDPAGVVVLINDTELNWLGYRRDEIVGLPYAQLLSPASVLAFQACMPKFWEQGWVRNVELELLRKDGTSLPVLVNANTVRDGQGGFSLSRATVLDMTERRRADSLNRRLHRALKLLSLCNKLQSQAQNEADLLQAVCQLAIDPGGYRMAWIGRAENDERQSVRVVSAGGGTLEYLNEITIEWRDSTLGQGPTGRAIRLGTTQVNQDVTANPLMAPWREQALRYGYRSSIALVLQLGDARAALTIYASEPDAFSHEEIELLEELATDISFGFNSLRMHGEHERLQGLQRRSLEEMVRAIAATLEMRDPYTAGHQRRVALLSQAIARAMGLDELRVHSLGLAASIHDLGKIQVPSEILSKPGKLSRLEFELIKRHAQVGFDILKDIEFSLPLAQWILQHHERLDGSGYPQGLKGDEILLESRILCVADVVEAIMSHRPYRPGLGLEVALGEITSKRGELYDERAVDACVALFRNDHFFFES